MRSRSFRIHTDLDEDIKVIKAKYGCDTRVEASKMASRLLRAREDEISELVKKWRVGRR
jgi:hypothetical protein